MQGLIESPDVQRALIARAIIEDHLGMTAMAVKIDKLAADIEKLTELVKEAELPKLNADVEKLMGLFTGAKSVVWAVTWVGGLGAVFTALGHLLAPYVTWSQHK